MSLSMYRVSVTNFIHILGNLKALLEKGIAFSDAKKIDATVLPGSRLFPDMMPLSKQVQIATDNAKGCAARLAGQQPPVFEDSEQTMAELIARVQRTIDYLNTLNPAQIDGSEEKDILLKLGTYEAKFTGQSYLLTFALPNFYFHVTTAYNLLRHNGVEIGKRDFLGSIQ
ncbi:MAG TPA: DUF1993 domain-containing protein [Spongiibacteraceae bacterium]|jgi:hypothetical protein